MQKDVSSLIKTALIEYAKCHDEYSGNIMDFINHIDEAERKCNVLVHLEGNYAARRLNIVLSHYNTVLLSLNLALYDNYILFFRNCQALWKIFFS